MPVHFTNIDTAGSVYHPLLYSFKTLIVFILQMRKMKFRESRTREVSLTASE